MSFFHFFLVIISCIQCIYLVDSLKSMTEHRERLGIKGVARSCKTGMDAFCKCRGNLEKRHPKLCKDIVAQCRKSFCRPLCMRMAWKTKIHVHCELAPEWTECRQFKEDLRKAEDAIQAHFQSHVCSTREMACCHNDTKLLTHVENKHYGNQYPVGKLPLPMCRTEVERDARKILGLPAEMPPSSAGLNSKTTSGVGDSKLDDLLRRTPEKPKKSKHNREQLCDLCEKVIHAEIITNEDTTCIPPHGSLKKIMPNSLHERCLFLADMVGNMKHRLEHDLRENVCACAGCCDGGCYYRTEKHKPWIMNMVEKISHKFNDHGGFL